MRVIQAEDLYQLQTVNDPQISPDGQQVLYVQQRVDRKTEKKFTNLWLVPGDGGRRGSSPSAISEIRCRAGRPTASRSRSSPTRKDEKQAQIYLIPADGGEARPLTALQGSVSAISWSPDGTRLLIEFRRKDADAIEREQDEDKRTWAWWPATSPVCATKPTAWASCPRSAPTCGLSTWPTAR
ncbi:MAG: hypothetical protein R2856_34250 [Caldilineaceae bacterium]